MIYCTPVKVNGAHYLRARSEPRVVASGFPCSKFKLKKSICTLQLIIFSNIRPIPNTSPLINTTISQEGCCRTICFPTFVWVVFLFIVLLAVFSGYCLYMLLIEYYQQTFFNSIGVEGIYVLIVLFYLFALFQILAQRKVRQFNSLPFNGCCRNFPCFIPPLQVVRPSYLSNFSSDYCVR